MKYCKEIIIGVPRYPPQLLGTNRNGNYLYALHFVDFRWYNLDKNNAGINHGLGTIKNKAKILGDL